MTAISWPKQKIKGCKHVRIYGKTILEIWGDNNAGFTTVYEDLAKQFRFCPICGKERPDAKE